MLGDAPIKIEGQAKIKLVALDNEAGDRIAKFDEIADVRFVNTREVDLPSGEGKMNIDFKINASGTSQYNLDKGLLKVSEEIYNIDGRISSPANTVYQMPNLFVKITMKTTISTIQP